MDYLPLKLAVEARLGREVTLEEKVTLGQCLKELEGRKSASTFDEHVDGISTRVAPAVHASSSVKEYSLVDLEKLSHQYSKVHDDWVHVRNTIEKQISRQLTSEEKNFLKKSRASELPPDDERHRAGLLKWAKEAEVHYNKMDLGITLKKKPYNDDTGSNGKYYSEIESINNGYTEMHNTRIRANGDGAKGIVEIGYHIISINRHSLEGIDHDTVLIRLNAAMNDPPFKVRYADLKSNRLRESLPRLTSRRLSDLKDGTSIGGCAVSQILKDLEIFWSRQGETKKRKFSTSTKDVVTGKALIDFIAQKYYSSRETPRQICTYLLQNTHIYPVGMNLFLRRGSIDQNALYKFSKKSTIIWPEYHVDAFKKAIGRFEVAKEKGGEDGWDQLASTLATSLKGLLYTTEETASANEIYQKVQNCLEQLTAPSSPALGFKKLPQGELLLPAPEYILKVVDILMSVIFLCEAQKLPPDDRIQLCALAILQSYFDTHVFNKTSLPALLQAGLRKVSVVPFLSPFDTSRLDQDSTFRKINAQQHYAARILSRLQQFGVSPLDAGLESNRVLGYGRDTWISREGKIVMESILEFLKRESELAINLREVQIFGGGDATPSRFDVHEGVSSHQASFGDLQNTNTYGCLVEILGCLVENTYEYTATLFSNDDSMNVLLHMCAVSSSKALLDPLGRLFKQLCKGDSISCSKFIKYLCQRGQHKLQVDTSEDDFFGRDSFGRDSIAFIRMLLKKPEISTRALDDIYECVRMMVENDTDFAVRRRLLQLLVNSNKSVTAERIMRLQKIMYPALFTKNGYLDPTTLPVVRVEDVIRSWGQRNSIDYDGNLIVRDDHSLAKSAASWLQKNSSGEKQIECSLSINLKDVREIVSNSDHPTGVATDGLEMLKETHEWKQQLSGTTSSLHFTSYFDFFMLDIGSLNITYNCFGMSEEETTFWRETMGRASAARKSGKPLSFAMACDEEKYLKPDCFFEQFVFPSKKTYDGEETCKLDVACFGNKERVRCEALAKADAFAKKLVDKFHLAERTTDLPISFKFCMTGATREKYLGTFGSNDPLLQKIGEITTLTISNCITNNGSLPLYRR